MFEDMGQVDTCQWSEIGFKLEVYTNEVIKYLTNRYQLISKIDTS